MYENKVARHECIFRRPSPWGKRLVEGRSGDRLLLEAGNERRTTLERDGSSRQIGRFRA